MEGGKLTTPATVFQRTAPKRDSLAAELERDPQLSTAKRQQRASAFTSHMQHSSLERQLAALQLSKGELEAKLRERDVAIERLESDRRWLADREKAEKDEKERERQEREDEKRKSDRDIRALRNSYMALKEQHADLQDNHADLTRQTSQTIASQKAEIATLSHQVSALEDSLAELRRVSDQKSHAFEQLQAQFDELSEAQDANASSNAAKVKAEDDNWGIVREELHRQANHSRKVEAENAKMNAELVILRQRHASVEVLREQKRELERKLVDVDQLKEKAVKLEAELDAARREREEWASSSSSPAHTPVSVTQALSNLRLTYATLLEEHGGTTARLRQRELELADLEQRERATQEAVQQLKNEAKALKETISRSEQSRVLAEREVGFLQAMVASYTAEESAHPDSSHISDETLAQRVRQLEALLSDYKTTLSTMEKEISDLGGDPSSLGAARRPRKELLEELETERKAKEMAESALKEATESTTAHLAQIDKLEQTLFELQGEIGGGRHVPPNTRILSLRDNPASQWEDLSRKAMERVKEENEALLKRLKELEEGGARAAQSDMDDGEKEELVPRQSLESANKEKEELAEELKQKEKRLLRLKQVFSAKTDEFKEAIASILGVKLAFYPNGQVRVTSQFDLNAAFVFQPTKPSSSSSRSQHRQQPDNSDGGMTMQLIAQGEGGPEELPQLMRYWVEDQQCIPGFLASVTLECYEKMRREGRVPGS